MAQPLRTLLLYLLPHHALSRLVGWVARCGSIPFRGVLTRWFIRHYRVDMSEALESDPAVYPNFNSFFTRVLRPEARPIVHNTGKICCPNDGAISQLGNIHEAEVIQAKGRTYSLTELLGGTEVQAQPFFGGRFVTMYLSPGDYHRVHMPLSGHLVEMTRIPGRLFSVSPGYTEAIPRLFTRNERVACIFQTEAGRMAVVLVGAIFVGSIETVWAGEVTPIRGRESKVTSYFAGENGIQLEIGEELGRFNMGGSTVIVIFGPGCVEWQTGLVAGMRVRLGQSLGHVIAAGHVRAAPAELG
jgi:phosphatidylserine decarboxylase